MRPIEHAEVERTEAGAAALGLGEADHRIVAGAVRAHLEPGRGAPGGIGRAGFLAHHPLETQATDPSVEVLAPFLDVIGEAQGPGPGQNAPQDLFAGEKRQGPQVEVFEAQEVENVVGRRQRHRRPFGVQGAGQAPAFLQALEARLGVLVEHRHLAVEHQGVERQGPERPHQVGEGDRRFDAAAEEEVHVASRAAASALVGLSSGRRKQPVAVILELEDPARPRERLAAQLGQHHLDRAGIDRLFRRAEVCELLADLGRFGVSVAQLLDG